MRTARPLSPEKTRRTPVAHFLQRLVLVSFVTAITVSPIKAATNKLQAQGAAVGIHRTLTAGAHSGVTFSVANFNAWITASNNIFKANGCNIVFDPISTLSTFSETQFFDLQTKDMVALANAHPNFQFKVVNTITDTASGKKADGSTSGIFWDRLNFFGRLTVYGPPPNTAIIYNAPNAVLAHEWGHSRGLVDDYNNPLQLMWWNVTTQAGTQLTPLQCFILRYAFN